ncbi:hypothetical protein, partial [Paraburkholderia saeva]|uniref:hypothetical protein n=1 Tax=Paraburkholderia saeva TaxID=2777537 RepID=UPI001E4BFDEA
PFALFAEPQTERETDHRAPIGTHRDRRIVDRERQQFGTLPTATSSVQRSLMLADSANTSAGYVAIATNSLLLGASQRSGAARGDAVPSDAQLGDYALDLQQISLMLNTLVMCSLRQPE